MKKIYIYFIFILASFVFSGCKTDNSFDLNALNSKYSNELLILKENHQKELINLNEQLTTKFNQKISAQEVQLQSIANSLYGEQIARDSLSQDYAKTMPRAIHIMHNRATEAFAATGKEPTIEAIKEENDRLKKELDEKLTSYESLVKTHDEIVLKMKNLANDAKLKDEEIANLKLKISDANTLYTKNIEEKASEITSLNSKINELNTQLKSNKDWENSIKQKGVFICGGLSIAFIIACIFLPLMRTEMILSAAILGGLAICIMYITVYVAIAIVIGAILTIGGVSYFKHRKRENELAQEKSAATDTYRAIQQIKTTSPEVYNSTVKPVLQEWQTTYDANGKPIANTSAAALIDKRLQEVGDK